MASVHFSKSKKWWYVSYRAADGRRTTKSSAEWRGARGKKLAMAWAKEIEAAQLRGDGFQPASGGVYFAPLALEFLADRRANGGDERHLYERARFFDKVARILSVKPVPDLTYDDCIKVATFYHGKVAQATINRYMRYIKTVFAWGVDHERIIKNPLTKWRAPKEPPAQPLLTLSDFGRIIKHAPPHLKLSLQIVYYTGIRPGKKELFALRWDNIDWRRQVIRVHGKGNRFREVIFGDALRKILLEARRGNESGFIIEYQGERVNKIRRALSTACRRAGLNYHVRLYDVRHLHASTVLAAGADLRAVSEQLGHSSTKMTADVYYHTLPDAKRRAASLMPEPVEPEGILIDAERWVH